MAYDADQHAESLVPPAFIWKGRRYVGRILSADEWVLLHAHRARQRALDDRRTARKAEVEHAQTGDLSAASIDRVVRETIGAARAFTRRCIVSWFPAPWYLQPFVWLYPSLNPAWRAFRQLPDATQVEAVKDFSASQRKAMPMESQAPGTTNNLTLVPPSAG